MEGVLVTALSNQMMLCLYSRCSCSLTIEAEGSSTPECLVDLSSPIFDHLNVPIRRLSWNDKNEL